MKDSAYKKSGVDTEAGIEVVDRIKTHVKKTVRPGVMQGLGGFGALFDMKETGYDDPVLVSATDGVGTKLRLAIDTGIHDYVGIDLVAMCVNDLVVQGAEPFFFLDYFATGQLDPAHAETVIAGIAKGCDMAGCALIGGETAEMPGMYGDGDYDLAGFSVGAVERNGIVNGQSDIRDGDVLIGLASSGIHSNGFSLVRYILKQNNITDLHEKTPFDPSLSFAQALLTPTRIYVKPLLQALAIKDEDGRAAIHGMSHITGGGYPENMPRMLGDGLCAEIDVSQWNLPPVFAWLRDAGDLSFDDLTATFNCGIGMVLAVDGQSAPQIVSALQDAGEDVYTIGRVTKADDGASVRLKNADAWD